MFFTSLIKNVFIDFYSPIFVAKVVTKNKKVTDFKLVFHNKEFLEFFPCLKKTSTLKNHISSKFTNVDLFVLAQEVFSTEKKLYKDCYFPEAEKWFRVCISKMKKNYLAFSFTDISAILQKDSCLYNEYSFKNKLIKALDTRGIELYFQPQVDISTKTLRGFEALVRWNDPELGWINPEDFIPMAEESNLIIPLGDWVLDSCCYYLKKWKKDFDFNGILSVNVSPVQLKNPTFLSDLCSTIKKYDVSPNQIEIEITEGVLIENMEKAVELLNKIKSLGIGISLDDFGTGYASLSYLQTLPLTTLKIDKSFITNIAAESSKSADITNAIVSLVTKMGLETIAEGVENSEQLEILESINCKNTQGFLMGKPMPVELCERMLSGDVSAILRTDSNALLYKI